MIEVNKLSDLRNFFASYFHENWPYEADNVDEIVKTYAIKNEAEHLRTLSNSILYYIDGIKDDRDLDELLFEELRCYYVPPRDGIKTRDWLRRVAQILVADTSANDKS